MKESDTKENYFGEVFLLFRKAKGFTQKEAAGSDISSNELSNFENGKSMLGADKFFQVLQNINVNSFEFQFAYNNYLESRDVLLFDLEVSDAYRNSNVSKLTQILKRLENLSKEVPQKPKFQLDKINVEALLSVLTPSFKVPREDVVYVQNYLHNINEWGLYDIILFGRCVTILNVGTISELAYNMISPAQLSTKIHYVQTEMIRTLLNVISVFIEEKQFNLASRFINFLDDNKIHEYLMFEKMTLIYDKASLAYHKGNKEAINIMEKCLKILEFCECFGTANAVAKEISYLKKEN